MNVPSPVHCPLHTVHCPLSTVHYPLSTNKERLSMSTGILKKYLGTDTVVVLPEGIEYIDDRAFEGCDITSITLPESLAEVGDRVFASCRELREVIFRESPVKIGEGIFAFCPSLEKIRILSKKGAYTAIYNCLIHKRTKTLIGGCRSSIIPKGEVLAIAPYAFEGCRELTHIDIPSSVTSIGDSAFSGCTSLSGITLPNSVKKLSARAFEGCTSLRDVTLSRSLTRLSSLTFSKTAITEITVPEGICEIQGNPFAACRELRTLRVEDGNTVFYERGGCIIKRDECAVVCGCASSRLPRETRKICELAFSYCDISDITLPEALEYIGKGAFSGCGRLVSLTVPRGVTEICSFALADCESLERIVIEGNPRIGKNLLDGSENAVIVAPNMPLGRLRGYENAAMRGMCEGYARGDIYERKILASYIFYAVRNKASIASVAEKEMSYLKLALSESVLDKALATALFDKATESNDAERVSMLMEYLASLGDGKSKDGDGDSLLHDELSFDLLLAPKTLSELKKEWKYEKKPDGSIRLLLYTGKDARLEIPALFGKSRVTEIGDSALAGYSELISVRVPDSVTHIGKRAFYGCAALSELTLSAGLRVIGEEAFGLCTSLGGLQLPKELSEIGREAFRGCSEITSVTLPKSLVSLGDGAFTGCPRLTSVSAENGNPRFISRSNCIITSEDGILVACAAKAAVPDDGSVRIIGQCFMYNTVIEEIVIPDSVTEIECNALEGCTALRELILPKHLTALPSFVFSGCTALERVVAGGDITEFGIFPFEGCERAVLYAPRGSKTAKNATECEIKVIEI